MHPSVTGTTAQRLRVLAELYQQGKASQLTERTLDKLLTYEIDLCQKQLSQLQADLAQFEQQYSLSSVDFYQRYQASQIDDQMDYVEWASLVQMFHNLKNQLQLLTNENNP